MGVGNRCDSGSEGRRRINGTDTTLKFLPQPKFGREGMLGTGGRTIIVCVALCGCVLEHSRTSSIGHTHTHTQTNQSHTHTNKRTNEPIPPTVHVYILVPIPPRMARTFVPVCERYTINLPITDHVAHPFLGKMRRSDHNTNTVRRSGRNPSRSTHARTHRLSGLFLFPGNSGKGRKHNCRSGGLQRRGHHHPTTPKRHCPGCRHQYIIFLKIRFTFLSHLREPRNRSFQMIFLACGYLKIYQCV